MKITKLKEFEKLMKKQVNIIVMITTECNLKCTYCYQNFKHITMNSEIISQLYNWGYLYLRDVKNKSKIDEINLIFHGGECLLYPEKIIEVYKIFKKISLDLGFSLRCRIVSNGTIFNEEVKKILFFIKELKEIKITIDGPPIIHNRRRKMKNFSSDTYKLSMRFLENVMKLSNNVVLEIRVNVDRENYPFISSWLPVIPKYKKIYLHRIFITFSETLPPSFTIEEKIEMFKTLWMLLYKLDLPLPHYYAEPGLFCPGRSPYTRVIYPDGTIYSCYLFVNFKLFDVGNIFNNFNLNDGDSLFSIYKQRISNCIKNNCKFLGICGGGCIFIDYLSNKNCFLKVNCRDRKTMDELNRFLNKIKRRF